MGGDLRHILKAAAAALTITLWATLASASSATVSLHWTAPGDDSLTGRATTYDLRYALFPITQKNFATATRWTSMSPPLPAGSKESYTINNLTPNTLYYFALKTADEVGNWSALSNLLIQSTAIVVGVDDGGGAALQFSAPQPNPARGTTAFTLGLPRAEDVHIAAYDVQGRLVKILLSGQRPPGQLRLVWNLDDSNGRAVSTGVYLVRARLGTEWFERRVAVVR